jgi:hypothetical protein
MAVSRLWGITASQQGCARGKALMDNIEPKDVPNGAVEASADVIRMLPVWDPNLIWDEGGWPIGCIEQVEAPKPDLLRR